MRILTKQDLENVEGLSSRKAAAVLGVGKSTINDARKALAEGTLPEKQRAKILTIDIESKPLTVYTWGLWDQNIGIGQILDHGGMMCFAAKWLGSDEVLFYSEFEHGYDTMVAKAWELLSEADIVISYNGDRYDFKKLNNAFLLNGMPPPKPYKSIDLIKTNKNRFDLPSRKLDYLVQQTGVGAKVKHQGFDLWIDCMNGDPEAWKVMEEYNRGDVLVTEGAYIHLLPWLTNVPHIGMFTGDAASCDKCGSTDLTPEGETGALVQKYLLFSCDNCKAWVRGNTRLINTIKTRAAR